MQSSCQIVNSAIQTSLLIGANQKVQSEMVQQVETLMHKVRQTILHGLNMKKNKGTIPFSNLSGVSYYNEVQEWKLILGYLYDLQVDVFCLSELNLNLTHPIVRDFIYKYKRSTDKHCKLQIAYSKPFKKSAEFQMGGTITGVTGRWSGRNLNLKLDLPVKEYGRWSLAHLQGKGKSIITIISIYRVCKQGGGGKNTIWLQQQRDIQSATGQLVNPRTKFTEDMATLLHFLQQRNHHVIICGDVNNDMNDKSSSNTWRSMLQSCNMSVVTDIKFPGASLPATYERGTRCLDMVAISSGIPINTFQGRVKTARLGKFV